jgi:hypothetical protein
MITQSGLSDYLLDAANMGANATRDLIYDLLSNDQRQRLENE